MKTNIVFALIISIALLLFCMCTNLETQWVHENLTKVIREHLYLWILLLRSYKDKRPLLQNCLLMSSLLVSASLFLFLSLLPPHPFLFLSLPPLVLVDSWVCSWIVKKSPTELNFTSVFALHLYDVENLICLFKFYIFISYLGIMTATNTVNLDERFKIDNV